MKIVFFGASVTAQNVNHKTNEATGYFPLLDKFYKENDSSIELDRVTAGSSHFNDAGYCLLDKVISLNPDVVFLDWNSTSLAKFDPILFGSFLEKLQQARAHAVFMLLPRKSCLKNYKERPNTAQVLNSIGPKVDCLDLYEELKLDEALCFEYLRDECHTTPFGAEKYAKTIIRKIDKIKASNINWGLERHDKVSPCLKLVPVSRFSISPKYTDVYGLNLAIRKMPSHFNGLTILLDNKVGPFSPVCSISVIDLDLKKETSVWDRYCYYTRQNFTSLSCFRGITVDQVLEVKISILSKDPDYTLSNQPGKFAAPESRHLKVKDVYIIGGEILKCTFDGGLANDWVE